MTTPDDIRCAAVKPGEKIEFQGRTLIETPDIAEPQLRLANALISDQCFDQAVQLIDQFVQANPDNDHVFFAKARLKWILFSQAQGRLVVDRALQLRPDFSSMKILLASMYLEEQNFPEASKRLDEVEKVHPEDLWLFMDRLRVEAGVAGSPATLETLTAVMADPHFPPSARGQAMKTAKYMDGITQEQRDQFFASSMDAGGADPNGRCEHESLVGTLLLTASWNKVAERQSILRSLLERGARVELLHSCADPALGGRLPHDLLPDPEGV